jgi:hypothetical protein
MSVAFSAVLIFLIFVPGFILRRVYLSYPFSRKYAISSPFDDIAAIVLAIVLQAAMCGLVTLVSSYRVDLPLLGALIIGTHSDALQSFALRDVQNHLGAITAYNLSLWAIAGAAGFLARGVVLKFELDRKFTFLRFNNDWYYLLMGREWGLKEGADFDLVWIDALVKAGTSQVIYSGTLHSFFLAKDGGLDSICITDAQKWMTPGAFAPITIPGQGFVIKYSEVLNVNVVFYQLREDPPQSPACPAF